jgi:AraC-like DNA-binding protein
MTQKNNKKPISAAEGFGPLVDEFDAIEALNVFYAGHGWDCQYRQVGEGKLRVKVVSQVTEQLVYGRERANRRIWGQAMSAGGVISVILAAKSTDILINGRKLSTDRMFIVPPNTSMDIVLGRGADALTILVPFDTFEDCCSMIDSDKSAALSRTLTACAFGDDALEPIRQLVLGALGNTPGPEAAAAFEKSFLKELAGLCKSDECQVVAEDPYRRLRKHDSTRRAIAFIHSNLRDTISMKELCDVCGTSLSTLERRFKRFLNVTPKHYILDARLNHVRRDLLDSRLSDLSIAEVAMRYNLLHMGRFSAQYNTLFGRLPSEDRATATNGGPMPVET